MRAVALDVHRDFCEVAIVAEGRLRSAGRIEARPEALELFGRSLDRRDWVALEVTGNAWEIARILEPHVARVIVVSPSDTGIRQARAKTDRLDARALAKLLWAGELDGVWTPDERVRAMRRRLARRAQLVRARSRAKNEIHAVLMRCLKDRPPASDLFGVKGRRWLAEQQLPITERETVDSAMRQVEFLDAEIAAVERLIAAEALSWPEIKRLMTVPGRQRHRGRDVHRRRRRHPPLPRSPQADRLPRTGPARPPVWCRPRRARAHLQTGLGQRPARARRGVLDDGPPARPDRRLLSARQGAPRALDRDRRLSAQARVSVLVPAHPRRGLRLRPTLADQEEDAPPRAAGRRPAAGRAAAASGRPTTRCARPNASSPCRPSAPTNAPSTTARRARWVRARHRAAHLMARQASKSRGRPQALRLRFDSSSPAPTPSLPPPELAQQLHLTFIRRPFRQSRPARRCSCLASMRWPDPGAAPFASRPP